MSERGQGEGNTDAPRVEENDVRSGQGREASGPRRVSEVREEREAGGNSETAGSLSGPGRETERGADRGTSWLSVILG